MIRSATQLLWSAAGCPDPRREIGEHPEAPCYWCGVQTRSGARVGAVLSGSFTDHDKSSAPLSPILCAACTWSMTGRPPDTLRLWSLLYREDRLAAPSHAKAPALGAQIHAQNKADPGEFDDALRNPPRGPWVCSIADSGQLHVVPFAAVNNGGGTWCVRFERLDVRATPQTYSEIADAMSSLYESGFSKEDIGTGAPYPGRLRGEGLSIWRGADSILARHRSGVVFKLALFLLRKKDAPPQSEIGDM